MHKRIGDDLRRIALLGHPLDLRLQPWDGGSPINLDVYRGRVVVLLFWASWSMPSLHELARLEHDATQFADQPVDFLTVSLGRGPGGAGLNHQGGQTCVGPCIVTGAAGRANSCASLGINALPTVWVLDRKGKSAHAERP